MKFPTLLSTLTLATAVLAHGGVKLYTIGDEEYPGNLWYLLNGTTPIPDPTTPSIQRRWTYYPIYNLTGPNITCNYDASETSPSLHAPIAAGTNITAHWNIYMPSPIFPDGWLHGSGPLLTYMARCPGDSCAGFDGLGAVWFKIDQLGLTPEATNMNGVWWQWPLIGSGVNGYQPPGYTVTIPSNLKAGKYLIRHEVIMLASIPAQFYPECAQLEVTGDGTATPSEDFLVSFPGAYRDDDPGIALARWQIGGGSPFLPEWNTTDYPFPGPAVWTGE